MHGYLHYHIISVFFGVATEKKRGKGGKKSLSSPPSSSSSSSSPPPPPSSSASSATMANLSLETLTLIPRPHPQSLHKSPVCPFPSVRPPQSSFSALLPRPPFVALSQNPKPSPCRASSCKTLTSWSPDSGDEVGYFAAPLLEAGDDRPHDECGVVGIYGDPEASRLCYLALHSLQHRGQEGAGIVSMPSSPTADGRRAAPISITGLGLVTDVFNDAGLRQLVGDSAIGHVRYSTAGSSKLKNVQPFVYGYYFGSVGVAHNGNLVNYPALRSALERRGSIFNTSSDTEVILHLIAISKARPFVARIVNACEQLEGAYSLVFLTEDKLVAVRDPHGFRPLVMGRRSNGAVVFASETCALDLIEATYEREVNPGEVVVVERDLDGDGSELSITSLCLLPHKERKACVFELIYFSLPNSVVFGHSVYNSRYHFGQALAMEDPVKCDVVIAVPDSGVVAALGYAAKAGVPFQQGLIRSHYVGRTFIEPSQKIRDFGVKLKLAPVQAVLEGKRVVVVDDSIVRGTTSTKIVRLLKEAGAKEVHMRIASPPIIGSCYYGVDTPEPEELISNRMDVEKVREFIGADTLAYLKLENLRKLLGEESSGFCYACFSLNYPVDPYKGKEKQEDDGQPEDLNSYGGDNLQKKVAANY